MGRLRDADSLETQQRLDSLDDVIEAESRKVRCFPSDGETDEPESLGAIPLAGRRPSGEPSPNVLNRKSGGAA